ncbi:phospholipase D/Transphosphatidylase [Pseudoxanthomonas suwonensis 11-1]|uniref:Phospholipase D/Transphosphatidylase n=1 Tax=Pseudoxanthomonas suwonensis (strain 11-1) TaxID=743721 RepID=E6WP45_PSEUU|nr:phospholipase D family protein [Pseudoxanthomonas suwonensis]ADV25944.1 phospholipase D/Transphosphatidylase [Pseudoxanthomonas suwonensis 11-1]
MRLLLAAALAVSASACSTLGPQQRDQAAALAVAARDASLDCERADRCAEPSPLRDLAGEAFAETASAPDGQPRHRALILDGGGDALLARINLMRSATRRIDLQTYIFDKDDSARLVIDELLAAARRGVKVRVLIDQLSAIADVEILAALAGAHENLQLRIYNPTFGLAKPNYLHYAASVVCCFRRFNQRMHNKLLVIDDAVGISGGRNYQDDYYDWDGEYNFRDRDVLVAGPVVREMERNFAAYWNDRRSVPVERLDDVARLLLAAGVPELPPAQPARPDRVGQMREAAADAALVEERLARHAMPVGQVRYLADVPRKHREGPVEGKGAAGLAGLLAQAREEVLLQTPYLVLSDSAVEIFRGLRQRAEPPRVVASTNSLAATDNAIVYALSYKYKRRNVRELGFDLFEYKPFPEDPPVDPALGAWQPGDPETQDPEVARSELPGAGSSGPRAKRARPEPGDNRRRVRDKLRTESRPSLLSTSAPANRPLPVRAQGKRPRMGLHAKSLVIDRRIGVVGTHNFDPRSETYNTEAVVVIEDEAFAAALAASIERDIAPGNSWTVAPRARPPVLSGLNYSMGKVLERSPVLDLWPWRYATNYVFQPGPECPAPLPRRDPRFHQCYVAVGDFPEVSLGPRSILTRMLTAFGAGLVPIL